MDGKLGTKCTFLEKPLKKPSTIDCIESQIKVEQARGNLVSAVAVSTDISPVYWTFNRMIRSYSK